MHRVRPLRRRLPCQRLQNLSAVPPVAVRPRCAQSARAQSARAQSARAQSARAQSARAGPSRRCSQTGPLAGGGRRRRALRRRVSLRVLRARRLAAALRADHAGEER